MTRPRSHTVRPGAPGYFHCVSRCVRRAWLCGEDPLSGRNFDHRKSWVERRLIELCDIFSVGLYGYAIMSNHVHTVLHVDPSAPWSWSDGEVARRWVSLSREIEGFAASSSPGELARRAQVLRNDSKRLSELRRRLGSLSWFMRYLNESIARAANGEDGCTGRFWEGRFHCQYLADERALAAAMNYVDLNPIRAGLATDLGDSHHTSAHARLALGRRRPEALAGPVRPLAGADSGTPLAMSVREYLDLVEWTSRQHRADRRHDHIDQTPGTVSKLGCRRERWGIVAMSVERLFGAAIGTRDSLLAFAERTGRQRIRGVNVAW